VSLDNSLHVYAFIGMSFSCAGAAFVRLASLMAGFWLVLGNSPSSVVLRLRGGVGEEALAPLLPGCVLDEPSVVAPTFAPCLHPSHSRHPQITKAFPDLVLKNKSLLSPHRTLHTPLT